MTWAAIAYKIHNGTIQIVAKASGPVRGEQTVFRAEASALLFLVLHTEASADVTLDAKGVKTRVERWSLGKTSLDLFIPIREHSERLQLHWIRSHQSLEQFCREFGRSQVWRWWANGEGHEEAIAASDKDTQVVQRFLAERVALLFSYDKDQGPQVFFERGGCHSLQKLQAHQSVPQDPQQVPQEVSADFACGGRRRTQQTRTVSGSGGQPALGSCLGLDL